MQVKRKENESAGSFIYRFTKKVQQSGVLIEARKRRFRNRPKSRLKMKEAALYREARRIEVAKENKLGKPGKEEKKGPPRRS